MQLGDQATPVIRRAKPTLASLASFAREAAPLSQTLDVSIDDVMGLLEGWARAIQDRDGVGHMFHGKATIGADFFRALVNGSLPSNVSARHTRKGSHPQPLPEVRVPRLPQPSLDKPLRRALDGVTKHLPALTPKAAAPPVSRDMRKVLDFLLGP